MDAPRLTMPSRRAWRESRHNEKSAGAPAMTPEDHETLELLEVLYTGEVQLPVDLRRALQESGLIEPAGERYRLTMACSLRLENLRSLARDGSGYRH